MSDCAVVWIRDDFRIRNNHALSYACKNHDAVTAIYIHNKNYFDGDSDALIVKGLVKIITEALSGLTNDEIKNLRHNLVNDLGLGPSLSARRQVGMMAMVDHIKITTGVK